MPHFNPYTNPKNAARRHAAIGKIHIGKDQLKMDDATYRAMLKTLGGVTSSKDLTNEGLNKVIRHLEKSGAVFTKAKRSGRKPNNLGSESDRAAKLSKIEALLADADRPWEYAITMAQHMYKKEALEFCSQHELSGIIAALAKNAKREGRRDR
jgi:phage gp16-like protein